MSDLEQRVRQVAEDMVAAGVVPLDVEAAVALIRRTLTGPAWPFRVTSEQTYRLVTDNHDNPGILCLRCGLASYHPGDIAERYCGNCHIWHADAGTGW